MDATTIPLGKLAETYVKIRAAKQKLQSEYDSKIEELEEKMTLVSLAMKDTLLAQKATSMKTEAGVVVLSKRARYDATDWDAMHKFIKEHDAFFLLEKRVHQGNMKQYVADNPDDVPPGLNINTEYVISVTKRKS
jgi:hypothetical protein